MLAMFWALPGVGLCKEAKKWPCLLGAENWILREQTIYVNQHENQESRWVSLGQRLPGKSPKWRGRAEGRLL